MYMLVRLFEELII